METTLSIVTERVDDLPLLFGHLDRMGLAALLDAHFPTDSHWRGLSLGQLSTGWLSHILSQADHRMKVVGEWAEHRLETLSHLFRVPVRSLDFSDDRLAALLKAFSDDEAWSAFEAALGGALLRVYDLEACSVRLDATTASGYFSVSDEGLFQFGHSKGEAISPRHHRPDLPQVKVMLSTLDPLALPVATQVLPGARADDPLYRPAIEAVRAGLDRRGLLYVGDCKMAALETRAFLEAGRDYYLCPLSKTHLGADGVMSFLEPLWRKAVTAVPIARTGDDGTREEIAEGFERSETLVSYVEGQPIVWQERQLVVRSLSQAKAASEALDRRLEQVFTALAALNERKQGKRRLTDWGEAHRAVEAILDRFSVAELISVEYEQTVTKDEVRRYGDRPARQIQLGGDVTIMARLNLAALEQARRRLAWRVYVTNQPREQLSLEQAVLAYRDQYRIEQSIGRLKGQPLSLSPLYVQRDDHIKGLIRLLSLALRVLVLLEYQVRRRLAEQGEALVGLCAARPRAATVRPTAERLLKAFAYQAFQMPLRYKPCSCPSFIMTHSGQTKRQTFKTNYGNTFDGAMLNHRPVGRLERIGYAFSFFFKPFATCMEERQQQESARWPWGETNSYRAVQRREGQIVGPDETAPAMLIHHSLMDLLIAGQPVRAVFTRHEPPAHRAETTTPLYRPSPSAAPLPTPPTCPQTTFRTAARTAGSGFSSTDWPTRWLLGHAAPTHPVRAPAPAH